MTTSESLAERDAAAALPSGFKRQLFRQLLTELGPLLVFFLAFVLGDIIWAAGCYAAATVVSVFVTATVHRKLPLVPLIATVLVTILAGLTIALEEEFYIKIRPTVGNGFFALVLAVGWVTGHRPVRHLLKPACTLDDDGERLLTFRLATYLFCLALANEIVWRSVSTDLWVVFKVFVVLGLNVLFAWSQLGLVRRHLRAPRDGDGPT